MDSEIGNDELKKLIQENENITLGKDFQDDLNAIIEQTKRMTLAKDFQPPTLRLIEDIIQPHVVPSHHMGHFNSFITDGDLEGIIEQEVPIQITSSKYVTFCNARFEPCRHFNQSTGKEEPLLPYTALLTKQTYAGIVSADAVICEKTADNVLLRLDKRRVDLFQMPMMVGSTHCNVKEKVLGKTYPGGHFIINGTPRVLIPFVRPNYNIPLVSSGKNDDKFHFLCEFRSRHQDLSILVQVKRDSEGYIFFSLPYIRSKLPAGLVLCALGYPFEEIVKNYKKKDFEDDEDMCDKEQVDEDSVRSYTKEDMEELAHFLGFSPTSMDKLMQQMCHDEDGHIFTSDEGFARLHKFLGKSKIEKSLDKLKQELKGEIFVHTGFGSFSVNAIYLLYMMRILEETAMGKRIVDDRESLIHKRVDTVHHHLGQLIRPFFRKSCKLLKEHFDKLKVASGTKVKGVDPFLPPSSMMKGEMTHDKIFTEIQTSMENAPMSGRIQTCFSTGRWDVSSNFKKNSYVREGVSQVLTQQNLIQRLSHMKRVTQPIDTNSINVKIHSPRLFSPSHVGFIDPYETPEGSTVGIVCNLACSVQISLGFSSFIAIDRVKQSSHLIQGFQVLPKGRVTLVLIDGLLIGSTDVPELLMQDLIRFRFLGHLPKDAAIVRHDSEIRISVDEGRFIRPLIVLKNNIPVWNQEMSLAQAIECRAVAYVSAEELDTALIAMTLQDLEEMTNDGVSVDYLEIHPTFLLSENSNLTNYSNCNQAPRNTYVTSMRKQSVGVPFPGTLDTNSYTLHYPQKPLVSTLHHRLLGFDEEPLGSNPVVAVMTIGGWNQEDSVVVNKASIERGLFNTTWMHVITEREKGVKDGSKRQKTAKTLSAQSPFHLSKNERWELLADELKNPQHLHTDLDERGIILPHSKRSPERRNIPLATFQVLISKKGIKKVEQAGKWVEVCFDASRVVSKGSEAGGFVDSVDVAMSPEGLTIVHITLRFPKIPEVGDKVASSHGQKGIIGKVYAQEDLPTTG